MPEHIRALVVILVLVTPVWWLAQRPLGSLVSVGTARRWRNVWYFVTLALFLSHNYWLFAFLLFAVAMAVRRQETHVVGLYFVLLFAGSPVSTEIPGFGLINYLLTIDHYRLLTLALLLPSAVVLLQSRRSTPIGKGPIDYLVVSYFLLVSALDFRDSSVTNGARGAVTHLIDILLPYYVVSRSIRTIEEFKGAFAGFIIAACLLAPLALFESVRGWRIYTAVQGPLGLNPFVWSGYLGRAGLLRSAVSLGHPIVLGFVFMVALGFMLFLGRSFTLRWQRWLIWAALTLGLLSSVSRGPWVGALLLGLAIVITADRPFQHLLKAAVMIALVFVALSLSTFGQQFLDLLPFFGGNEAESVDYRVELWSFVWPVVERNFWFGSQNYLMAPELRALAAVQGEGFADLVNHYFEVVLASGVVGLGLFCGSFLGALLGVWRVLRRKTTSEEPRLLGAALFCTLLSVFATISTVSNITAVSVIIWSLLGMCTAYSTMTRTPAKEPAGSSDISKHRLASANA